MKQQLTKEQSRRLIELGVPIEKASASIAEETQGNGCSWTYPVFTIGDLLDLLPKDLAEDGYSNLCVESCYDGEKYFWKVSYYGGLESIFAEKELIDSLFKLVIWCIKKECIKTDKL